MGKQGDGYKLQADLFTDMVNGKFKLVGELFPYSICVNGPSTKFLCPSIFMSV